MPGQLLPDCLAQNPCPFTVNYSNLVKTSHKGIIQVLVKLQQSFVYGEPAKVYFI